LNQFFVPAANCRGQVPGIFLHYNNQLMLKYLMLVAVVSATAVKAQIQNKQMEQKMTNQEMAAAINVAVQNGDAVTVARLVTEDYIQHTPVVANGRAGLVALVTRIRNKEMPAPVINNIRRFSDGDFVVLHHEVHWPNKKAMFEIFRMENGLAAEHWSGIMDHPATTANGHTMTDGVTTVSDQHLTDANKKLARGFVETVLIKGAFNRVPDFYDENIIQYNPLIDNTVSGLIKGLNELNKRGITIQIEKIVQVLGEGNFVLVCSTGKLAGKPTAFFDLFRVSNGKIVEHWDVLQEIPAQSANGNGFF
jgi:predicted SnoaL-like aldol condensation-catalyzing enzyme